MKFRFVILATVLASCGAVSKSDSATTLSVIENLAVRNSSVDRLPSVAREISEMMPVVHYKESGKSVFSISDMYVRGTVRDVEEGIGMSWNQDNSTVKETDYEFGDSRAQVETIHLVVKPKVVIDTNGNSASSENEIRIGLALSAPIDVSKAKQEFVTGKDFVFLTVSNNPVFYYDANIKSIVEDGTYFGAVMNGIAAFEVASRVIGKPITAVVSSLEHQKIISIGVHRENGFLVKD